MLLDVGGGGSECSGRPIFFFIKENWICAMTKHVYSSITLFFFIIEQCYKNNSLDFGKKFKNKSSFAVPQNIRARCQQSLVVTYIVLHVD